MEDWISVKDMLPELDNAMGKHTSNLVLICVIDPVPDEPPDVTFGYMFGNTWVYGSGAIVSGKVTHWMPLPEAPKTRKR